MHSVQDKYGVQALGVARVVEVCAGLTGVPQMLLCAAQAVGDELLDSIVSDNIPIFTEEERYNQTVLSSVERIEAKLNGQTVPGGWPAAGAVQFAGCTNALLLSHVHVLALFHATTLIPNAS